MPRVNLRKSLLWGALLLVLVVVALGYWRFGRAVEVEIVLVRPGAVAMQVSGPGTLQGRSAVTLASRLTSTVTAVSVDVGDEVQPGQLLATLDDRELAARRAALLGQQRAVASSIEAARAALRRAEAERALADLRVRRDAELRDQGFLSQSAWDASVAARQVAVAGLDAAQAALATRQAEADAVAQEVQAAEAAITHTRLHSPLQGLVVQRLAEPGSTVNVGTPLLRLVDPDTLWVATRVDESVVGRLAVGQQATIRFRAGDEVPGTVARLARQSDTATRELDVFVALARRPQHFALDQQAEVSIEAGRVSGLVVPATALIRNRDGRTGVLVVEQQRTAFRPVGVEGAEAGAVRVVSGLREGEMVVRDSSGARDNQAVRVIGPR